MDEGLSFRVHAGSTKNVQKATYISSFLSFCIYLTVFVNTEFTESYKNTHLVFSSKIFSTCNNIRTQNGKTTNKVITT